MSPPRTLAVIPARMGSSRFPGKPLADIHGRPMIEHVYRGARGCALLDEVVIATCDEVIADAASAFGARAIMTSSAHERATDRTAEACRDDAAEIVVMIQGDEPMIGADMVTSAVEPMLADESIACVNLAAPIRTAEEYANYNTIKVVVGAGGDALYFSRAPIPARVDSAFPGAAACHKQVCIIAFRRAALDRFAALGQTRLEAIESIDMLRFLEHGIPVRIVMTERDTQAVDTREDLRRVSELLAQRQAPANGRSGPGSST